MTNLSRIEFRGDGGSLKPCIILSGPQLPHDVCTLDIVDPRRDDNGLGWGVAQWTIKSAGASRKVDINISAAVSLIKSAIKTLFSELSQIFTMGKRRTLDDFIIVGPKKSTPREMTKVEAHVTTVTLEEIYLQASFDVWIQ
nr:unnamed protein product [Callosobruchus analis]